MFILRQKWMLGFGGLLAILLVSGTLSVILPTRYGGAIERIFRENSDSVVYSQNMKEAIEEMDENLRSDLWGEGGDVRRPTSQAVAWFEENLAKERGNITVPGERELAEQLARNTSNCRRTGRRKPRDGISTGGFCSLTHARSKNRHSGSSTSTSGA